MMVIVLMMIMMMMLIVMVKVRVVVLMMLVIRSKGMLAVIDLSPLPFFTATYTIITFCRNMFARFASPVD